MSRKILKIGTDVLTINNQLVSVKEDYPFWKVNQDTSEQYWSTFDAENTSVPYTVDITNIGGFVGTGMVGFITTDGITFYSIPNGDGNIKKFNTDTQTLTYIGSGLSTYLGGVAVGKYIYYIPLNATAILKLDTELDTITTIGSFAGSNKWGRPILLPNGIIFAPRYNATTHLTLDPTTDTVTLINATNVGSSDTYEAGTWYYNGFIYAIKGLSSVSGRIIKIDVNTYAETVFGSTTYGTSVIQCIHQYKNLVFIGCSTTYALIWDNISESYIGSITFPGNTSLGFRSIVMGMDGWLYLFSTNLLHYNIRINPKNFSFEVISTNPNTSGVQNAGIIASLNGKIFSFDGQGTDPGIKLINTGVNEVNNPNKKLHRIINKV